MAYACAHTSTIHEAHREGDKVMNGCSKIGRALDLRIL
jgi:hypothetical protein